VGVSVRVCVRVCMCFDSSHSLLISGGAVTYTTPASTYARAHATTLIDAIYRCCSLHLLFGLFSFVYCLCLGG